MKLEKIVFTNFRSIKQLELQLSDLTLIMGAHGAGKDTIFQALHLAYIVYLQGQEIEKVTKAPLFHLLFFLGSPTARVETVFTEDNRTASYIMHFVQETRGVNIEWRGDEELKEKIGIFLGKGHCPTPIPLTASQFSNSNLKILSMYGERVDWSIKEIVVEKNCLSWIDNMNRERNIAELSDRTQELLALIARILVWKKGGPSLLYINDFGDGWSADATQLVLDMLYSILRHGLQVILLTRHITLGDQIPMEDLRGLERIGDATKCYSFDGDWCDSWLEDYSISEIWRKGIRPWPTT